MRRLLVDTNLLVLLVVGQTGDALIDRHKRCEGFELADYEGLVAIVLEFDELLVTPYILAEVSNLVRQTREPDRSLVMATLGALMGVTAEKHHPAKELGTHALLPRFGLTDCATMEVLRQPDIHFLTTDFPLAVEVSRMNANVTNFHHLRTRWLLPG